MIKTVLASPRLMRPLKFAVIGGMNTAVDFGTFTFLVYGAHLSALIGNVIGFTLGSINSYVMNSVFTFRDRGSKLDNPVLAAGFLMVTLANLAVSTFIVVKLVGFTPAYTGKLVATALSLGIGFFLNNQFIFKLRAHRLRRIRQTDSCASRGPRSSAGPR